MKVNARSLAYALLLAAVAAAAAFFLVAQLDRPLVADEAQTSDVAQSLLKTARPEGYSGSRWNVVFIHPTLYYALVAAPVRIFGPAPWAARLPGLLAHAATAALLWFAARRVTGERWGPFLAVLLYALHPLAVQSSLLLDADAALLPLVATLFLYYLTRRDFALDRAGWLGLSLLFGVALLAKLTTPPLMLIALGLHYLLTGKRRRLGAVAAAAALGFLLFAAYIFPYAVLKHLPILKPFLHSGARVGAVGHADAAVVLGRGVKLALWLGAPLLAALGFLVGRILRRGRRATPDPVFFAVVTAFVILIFYLVVGGEGYGFVKYHAPLVPLVAFALAATFGPELGREPPRTVLVFGGGAFVYYLLAVRDPLYWPYVANEMKEFFLLAPTEVTKALALTGVFLVIPLVGALAMIKPRGWAPAFVVLAAAAAPALDVWHVTTDYAHSYNYGERGFGAVVKALAKVPDGKTIIAPADVAYADGYRHPHVATEDVLRDTARLRATLQDPATAVVVIRAAYYLHAPYRNALHDYGVTARLEGFYAFFHYGSFTVAVRKKAAAGAAEP